MYARHPCHMTDGDIASGIVNRGKEFEDKNLISSESYESPLPHPN